MIQVVCDNCSHVLRNEPDETGAEAEVHATLKLVVAKADKTIRPIDMDLCIKCAKRYLAVLKDPI